MKGSRDGESQDGKSRDGESCDLESREVVTILGDITWKSEREKP